MTISKQCIYNVIPVLLAVVMEACSGSGRPSSDSTGEADEVVNDALSAIFDASASGDYETMLELTDRFAAMDSISELEANYTRGLAYASLGHLRQAQSCMEAVISSHAKDAHERKVQSESYASLAVMLTNRGDYARALDYCIGALQIIDRLKADKNDSEQSKDDEYNPIEPIVLETMGRCYLSQNQMIEATQSYDRAYAIYIGNDPDKEDIEEHIKSLDSEKLRYAIVSTFNFTLSFLSAKHYREALLWVGRTDTLLYQYTILPDATQSFVDVVSARQKLNRATALQGLGKTTEADRAYDEFVKTEYAKSNDGLIDATQYLMAAGKYNTAADNFSQLDETLNKWGTELTLDNIQKYYIQKYRANVKAGRTDSAIAVGMQIAEMLDTAMENFKNDQTAELSAIYNSDKQRDEIEGQQKEINAQRIKMHYAVLIALVIVMLVVTVFLVVYTMHRRRNQKQMAGKNRELQDKIDELTSTRGQLDRTTRAKNQIEAEIDKAGKIQMSMLPRQMPVYEGLDLAASMTPAKMVGGDLYDFLLADEQLYFCVGDVSGKGVSAALFMAETVRLFHSMAVLRLTPEDIATNINEVLSENNDEGMFVTMFIGKIDLNSGHLDFCNAGHNPPVLGGDRAKGNFMPMETNVPIGMWPGVEFKGEHVDSIKHRPLFVYTDGLNEAENKEQEQYGDDRMLNILRHTEFQSAQHVIDTLKDEVERFRDGAEPSDDMTMLCLRVD